MILHPDTVHLHTSMLNDRSRTSAYLEAIACVVRPGDVVVDIGTGTGILAMAAAKAGAAHVYAIEIGKVAQAARQLFDVNGLSSQITLIRAWSSNVWLPERADVVISEVIGNDPFGEGVIGITRDALLRLGKPGARLLPSGIRVSLLPVTIADDELDKLTFTKRVTKSWQQWYGIDFAPLSAIGVPQSMPSFINPTEMRSWKFLTSPILLTHVGLRRRCGSNIRATRFARATSRGRVDAVVVYFELLAGFEPFLSTHPHHVDGDNHWLAPVYLLREPVFLSEGDAFRIHYGQNVPSGYSWCHVVPLDRANWPPEVGG